MTERNQAIIAEVASGAAFTDVGRKYGVTGERIRQIIRRHEADTARRDFAARGARRFDDTTPIRSLPFRVSTTETLRQFFDRTRGISRPTAGDLRRVEDRNLLAVPWLGMSAARLREIRAVVPYRPD